MLHGVAHEDVLGEGEGSVADLIVKPQDRVRLEGHSAWKGNPRILGLKIAQVFSISS